MKIGVLLWRRLVLELRRRGEGRHESGAFLLAPRNGKGDRITSFVCYDELDPNAYEGGVIAFHEAGYEALSDLCRKRELRVLADVHTHPAEWVGQSPTDKRNPMVPMIGHRAIILSHYAATGWWTLKAAGIHEYLGNFSWREYAADDAGRPVRRTLW